MSRRVPALPVLAALVAGTLLVALFAPGVASASPDVTAEEPGPKATAGAQGQGDLAMTMGNGAYAVRYHLAGAMLPERAEAAVAGWPVDALLTDSDSRYVHADLVSMARPTIVYPCPGDDSRTGTITWAGISASSSIIRTDLTLDLVKGTGEAHIGVANLPYVGGDYRAWMPGIVDTVQDDNCYAEPTHVVASGAAVGDRDPGVEIFDGFTMNRVLDLSWALVEQQGRWVLRGSSSLTPDGVHSVRIDADITFSGDPTSMHALCVTPTTKQLRPARTVAAAKRILARAGFPSVKVTQPKHTRAARKGHYYLPDLIGNRSPVMCGYPKLRLTRSLGWP
jgi:hypothetical protein